MTGLSPDTPHHGAQVGSIEGDAASELCFALPGVESVDHARDHMAARKIPSLARPSSSELVADEAVNLKACLLRLPQIVQKLNTHSA